MNEYLKRFLRRDAKKTEASIKSLQKKWSQLIPDLATIFDNTATFIKYITECPKEYMSRCKKFNIPYTTNVMQSRSNRSVNENCQLFLNCIKSRMTEFIVYVSTSCNVSLSLDEDLNVFEIADLIKPKEDDSLNEYITRIFSRFGADTNAPQFRGDFCNLFRIRLWEAIGSLSKMEKEDMLTRRSFYLTRFGIVVTDMFFSNKARRLTKLRDLAKECRYYRYNLFPENAEYYRSLASYVENESLNDFTKNNLFYCFEIMTNFKYSLHAQPEAQYVSLLWAPMFDAMIRRSEAHNILSSTTEYNLGNLTMYEKNAYVDYVSILSAASSDKVLFSAPVLFVEASGHHRFVKGKTYPMKDLVKNAVSMLHGFYYWYGAVKGDAEAEQNLRVYGMFLNKTEVQLLCMFLKRNHNEDASSLIFQVGDTWCFHIGKLSMESRERLFRKMGLSEPLFTGEFRMSNIFEIPGTELPETFLNPEVSEAPPSHEGINDFEDCDSAELCDYLRIIHGFILDVCEYSRWLHDYIQRRTEIIPGFPPTDSSREFPQSSSSHSESSPKKEYSTPLAAGKTATRVTPLTPTPMSSTANKYAKKKKMDILINEAHTYSYFCVVMKDGAQFALIVKPFAESSDQAEVIWNIRNARHAVKIYDYVVSEDRLHAVYHMELLEKVSFHDKNFFSLFSAVIEYLMDGLLGLCEMKSKGIVHGDISPNNFMYSPGDNIYKFIDFNQSFVVGQSHVHSFKGTKGFAAPELSDGICLFSSDLYSFGQTFCHVAYKYLQDVAAYSGFFESPCLLQLESLLGAMFSYDYKSRPSVEEIYDNVSSFWIENYKIFESNRYSDQARVGAEILCLRSTSLKEESFQFEREE